MPSTCFDDHFQCRKCPTINLREGPSTTTTIIFQKSFVASAATPKRHLMAHQMKNLFGFSVFHCVERAFGASSGGTPKMKNGAPRDELKNGRCRGWAVAYNQQSFFCESSEAVRLPREGLTSVQHLRKSGELPGKSGELPGNLWIALQIHSERSSGKSPRNFQGSLGKF